MADADPASFVWLLNVVETEFAGKESLVALQARADAAGDDIQTLESRFTAIEVDIRTMEGHGAFSEFRGRLQRQFDGKESLTALTLRATAFSVLADDVESDMAKSEVNLRIAEQDFLDYLTELAVE